jgi:Uma2 family endonuclease
VCSSKSDRSGLSEYWIVDPLQKTVSILTLSEGLYEEQTFVNAQEITSPTLPDLHLSPEKLFA